MTDSPETLSARAKTTARIMREYDAWEPPAEAPADPVDYARTAQVISDQADRIDALEAALKTCGSILEDMYRNGIVYTPPPDDGRRHWEPVGAYYLGEGIMPMIRAALQHKGNTQ